MATVRPARRVRLAVPSLTIATTVGILARLSVLTSRPGLFRDDAWVIAPVRASGSTQLHLTWTFPGFALLERAIASLDPASTLIVQLLPFVAGVLAIPVLAWAVASVLGDRTKALVVATVLGLSPVALTYSGRAKPYTLELLAGAVLLVLAERARASQRTADLWRFALGCTVGVAISFAVLPVVVGGWIAVGWSAPRVAAAQRRVLGIGGTAALAAGAIVALTFHGTPPSLHAFWSPFYVDTASPGAFLRSLERIGGGLVHGFFDAPLLRADHPVASLVTLAALLALLVVARRFARRLGEVAIAPLATLGTAFALAALRVVPLGTGRTDLVLTGAVAIVLAGGLASDASLRRGCVTTLSSIAVSVGALAVVVASFTVSAPTYPTTEWGALAHALSHVQAGPGSAGGGPELVDVVVDAPLRYDWALDPSGLGHPTFVLSNDHEPGYTVRSNEPDLFVAPADPGDPDFAPAAWAATITADARGPWSTAGVEFFGITAQVVNPTTGPLGGGARTIHRSPLYLALLADGWRAGPTTFGQGVFVQVLTRANL